MLNGDTIVYVTNTGSKYHSKGCGYLYSCKSRDLSTALKLYSPCSRCNPPKPIHNRGSQENSFSTRSSFQTNPFIPNNSTRLSSNNQSIFSFNVNSQQEVTESLLNHSDIISDEELKQLVEEKVKGVFESKIKELEKSLLNLQDKMDKDWMEQNRLTREKNQKLENLSDEVKMIKFQNVGLCNEIEDLKQKNIKFSEKVEQLEKRNISMSIEKFDFNFSHSNEFTINENKISEFVELNIPYEVNQHNAKKYASYKPEIEKLKIMKTNTKKKIKQRNKEKDIVEAATSSEVHEDLIKSVNSIGNKILNLIKNIPHSLYLRSKGLVKSTQKKNLNNLNNINNSKKRKKRTYCEQANPMTIDSRSETSPYLDKVISLPEILIPFFTTSDQTVEAIDIKSLVNHNFNFISNKI